MGNRLSILIALVLPICLRSTAAANALYWDGAVSGNWATPANWNVLNYADMQYYPSSHAPSGGDFVFVYSATYPQHYTALYNDISGLDLIDLCMNLDGISMSGNSFSLSEMVYLNCAGAGSAKIDNNIGLAGSQVVANVYDQDTLTLNGILSGNGGIRTSEAGTLVLGGTNTFTGILSHRCGTLQISRSGNLGNASLIEIGSLNFSDPATVLKYTGTGSSTAANTFKLMGNTVFDVASGELNLAGALQGLPDLTDSITKRGAGKLTLSGTNTIDSTDYIIQEGTLSISSAANLGSLGASAGILLDGGTLETTASTSLAGGLSLRVGTNGGAINTASGTLTAGTVLYDGSTQSMFTKTGAGTLSLNALNVRTTINQGKIVTLTANYDVINNGQLEMSPGTNSTFSHALSGTGDFIKSGVGTLTYSGTNSSTGRTFLNGGTLEISSDAKLGTVPATFDADRLSFDGGTLRTTSSFALPANRGITLSSGGGKLDVAAGTTLTAGSIIAGSGSLTKLGDGTLALGAVNTFTGDLLINRGTVRIDGSNTLPDSTYLNMSSGGTFDLNDVTDVCIGGIEGYGYIRLRSSNLRVQGSRDTVFSGHIQDTGQFIKSGTGTLTLSNSNTYTGNTRIMQGTVKASGGYALPDSSALTIDNTAGATLELLADEQVGSLAGGGAVGGVVILNGYRLTLGGNNTDTTFSGTFKYDAAHTADAGMVTKIGTGTFALDGYGDFVNLTISGGRVKTDAASIGGNVRNDAVLEFAQPVDATSKININGGGDLVKTGAGKLTLAGNNTCYGQTTITEGALRVTGGYAIDDESSVDINSSMGACLELGASETIGSLSGGGGVVLNSFTLTLGGNDLNAVHTGVIAGAGGLVKIGTGTQTLAGNCSYSGGTTISGGRLKGNHGTLQGMFTDDSELELCEVSTNGTFTGTISGKGDLIKTGGGYLVLQNSQSYTGITRIEQGSLRLGANEQLAAASNLDVSAAGTFDLNGYTESLGAISGQGLIDLNGGILRTSLSGTSTFSGTITDAGQLIKQGSGTLTLSGVNTYSGQTSLEGGTVQVSADSNLGNAASQVCFDGGTLRVTGKTFTMTGRDVTMTGPGTLDIADAANTLVWQGQISGGSQTLTKAGAGALDLSATNTWTGKTSVAGGTLIIHADKSLGTAPASAVADQLSLNGSTLAAGSTAVSLAGNRGITLGLNGGSFDTGANNLTIKGNIAGPGALTKSGTGKCYLSGTNTWLGATNITEGSLLAVDGHAIPDTSAVSIGAAGVFDLSDSETIGSLSGAGRIHLHANGLTLSAYADTTFTGDIDGTGTLTKRGTSAFTYSGSASYTGNTTVGAGTFKLGRNDCLADVSRLIVDGAGSSFRLNGFNETLGSLAGNGEVRLDGGTLTVGGDGTDATYSGTILGSGNLAKIGNGWQTLTANSSTLAGNLTVSGGTLMLDGQYPGIQKTSVLGGTLQINHASGLPGGAPVALDGGGTLHLNPCTGQTWTYDQAISGTGHLIKTGDGTLVLNNSSHGGMTTIRQGTLVINDSLWAPGQMITVEQNGTLAAQGTIQRGLMGAGRVTATGDLMIGSISGGGSVNFDGLVEVGSNRVTLLSSYQVWLGSATLSGGNLSALQGIWLTHTLTGHGAVEGSFHNGGTVTGGSQPWEPLEFKGLVTGDGSFAGNVQFSNIYSPGNSPAEVSLENMLLMNTSVLQMELAGTLRGTQYDHLNFSGTATLDGLLAVSLIDGFTPSLGQSFDLFDGTLAGQFDVVQLPPLTAGWSWDTTDLYTDGTISVVPEPPTLVLLGTILAYRLRRRSACTR